MTVMSAGSSPSTIQSPPDDRAELRAIAAQMQIALAHLRAALARAEVERLQEQLAWERAWRRRGLLGRLF